MQITVGKLVKIDLDKEVAEFIFDANLTDRVFFARANENDIELTYSSKEDGASFGWTDRVSYEKFKEKVGEYIKNNTRVLER